MEKKNSNLVNKLKLGAAIIFLATSGGFGICSRFGTDEITTTIRNAERDHKTKMYLIYTDDGTFRNEDAVYRFKCNSSDMNGEALKYIGKKVVLTSYGWRIHGCGSGCTNYENVVDIQPVEE